MNQILELVSQIKTKSKGKTISVAESCTGGMLATYLTSISGASAYFISSIVSYSNEAKIRLLSVDAETLVKYGAVSEEVAREMAVGVRKVSGSDIAISITGVAGPEGGTQNKPVGTVCFGVATNSGVRSCTHYLKGERENIRRESCRIGLEMILDSM